MQWIAGVSAVLVSAAIWGASGSNPAGLTAHPLTQLTWLAGCLELRSGDRVVEEHRMGLRGGSMLGMGRTTSSQGLVDYELTLIRERAGKVVLEAHPSGQAAATFTASAVGPDSVVFEASGHDYPQIVGYRRMNGDSVLAWIDGRSEGKRRRVEFPYGRVACPR